MWMVTSKVLIISKAHKTHLPGCLGILAIISRPISHTWLSKLEKLKYLYHTNSVQQFRTDLGTQVFQTYRLYVRLWR